MDWTAHESRSTFQERSDISPIRISPIRIRLGFGFPQGRRCSPTIPPVKTGDHSAESNSIVGSAVTFVLNHPRHEGIIRQVTLPLSEVQGWGESHSQRGGQLAGGSAGGSAGRGGSGVHVAATTTSPDRRSCTRSKPLQHGLWIGLIRSENE